MAKIKFHSINCNLFGVFRVGYAWSLFRTLIAAFGDENQAKEFAEKYSEENFACTTMIEQVKVTVPAWDGTVPSAS